MIKAVLVMDMPKRCSECRFCLQVKQKNGLALCLAIDDNKPTEYNPKHELEWLADWCPLRELPSKYAEKDFTPIKDERYDNGYEDGYNACIDELLKGEEG